MAGQGLQSLVVVLSRSVPRGLCCLPCFGPFLEIEILVPIAAPLLRPPSSAFHFGGRLFLCLLNRRAFLNRQIPVTVAHRQGPVQPHLHPYLGSPQSRRNCLPLDLIELPLPRQSVIR